MSEPAADTPAERIKDLFARAVQQPAAERAAFLERACGGDQRLRAEVLSLLRWEPTDAFLAGSVPAMLAQPDPMASGDSQAPDAAVTRRIDGHRLLREIGRGGMGVVYEAVAVDLGRRVALKVLAPHLQVDERFLERFRREAQAAAVLAHDHIVPVFGTGSSDGCHWFTMQFIDGLSLDQLLAARRRWHESTPPGSDHEPDLLEFLRTPALGAPKTACPPSTPTTSHRHDRLRWAHRAAALIERAADAVAHAHARGVLHRDLKPSNLLLDLDGKLWVSDFGLARIEGAADLTHSGEMLGTLRYLAPEALHSHGDERTDVHALGLILYELLTLTPAFDAVDRPQLLAKVNRGCSLRPRRIDPSIPRDLETIVRKATDPLPEARYGSAAALAADLRAFGSARPIAAKPPTFVRLLALAVRRHRAVSITAALAVLLVSIGTGAYVRHLGAALQAAEQATDTANRERAEAQFRSYVAGIAAAQAALDHGDVVTAQEHLEAAPEHLRGWEWRHVHAQLDTSIRTFSIERGKVSDRPHDVRVCAKFHPDGRRLLGVSDIGIRLWDIDSGDVLATAPSSYSIAWKKFVWGPRAESFLITRPGNAVESWTLSPLRRVAQFPLPASPRAIASDGAHERCAVGVNTGELVLLALPDGRLLGRWHFTESVHAVSFAPDDRSLALLAGPGLHTIDLATGDTRFVARVAGGTQGLAHDPSRNVVAVGDDQAILGIDLDSGQTVWSLPADGRPVDLEFSPDGRLLASATMRQGSTVWNIEQRTVVHTASHGHRAWTVSFDRTGRRLVSGASDVAFKVFDLDAPGIATETKAHARDVDSMATSRDGAWIVTRSGRCGSLVLFDARTFEKVAAWPHNDIKAFTFAPDGHLLARRQSRRNDGWRLHLVALPELQSVREVPTPYQPDIMTFSTAGDALFVGRREAALTRHAWPGGRVEWTQPLRFQTLRVAPDGRLLAGARGKAVTLVDAATGSVVRELERTHDDDVLSMAFFAGGTRLATVSLDQTVSFWDVATGACLVRRGGHAHGIHSVAPSPDGTRLLTAARDGILKLWDPERASEVLSVRARGWLRACYDATGDRILYWSSDGILGSLASDRQPTLADWMRTQRAIAPQVDALASALEATHGDDTAAALAELAASPDLAADVRRTVERRVRSLPGEERWLVARAWRTVVDPTATRAAVDASHRHMDSLFFVRTSARNRLMLGASEYRQGDVGAALALLAGGDFSELDPRLTQTRLAFLALAQARSKQRPAAQATLAELAADVHRRERRIPAELLAEVERVVGPTSR